MDAAVVSVVPGKLAVRPGLQRVCASLQQPLDDCL